MKEKYRDYSDVIPVFFFLKYNPSLRIEDIAKLAGIGRTITSLIITDLKSLCKTEHFG